MPDMSELQEYISGLTGKEVDAAVLMLMSRYLATFNGRSGPNITPQAGDYDASKIGNGGIGIPENFESIITGSNVGQLFTSLLEFLSNDYEKISGLIHDYELLYNYTHILIATEQQIGVADGYPLYRFISNKGVSISGAGWHNNLDFGLPGNIRNVYLIQSMHSQGPSTKYLISCNSNGTLNVYQNPSETYSISRIYIYMLYTKTTDTLIE